MKFFLLQAGAQGIIWTLLIQSGATTAFWIPITKAELSRENLA